MALPDAAIVSRFAGVHIGYRLTAEWLPITHIFSRESSEKRLTAGNVLVEDNE